MEKQSIIICSPRLHQRSRNLANPAGHLFVCLEMLEAVIVLPESPVYWLELATTQWHDRSGYGVWVQSFCRGIVWRWGWTREAQNMATFPAMNDFLGTAGLPSGRPVRVFFRMSYLG